MTTKFLLNGREMTKEELRDAIGDTYFEYAMERIIEEQDELGYEDHEVLLPNGDVVEAFEIEEMFNDIDDDDENSSYARVELQNLVAELAESNGLSETDTEADVRYYARFVADEEDDVDKAYEDAEMELGIRTQEQHFLFIDLVNAELGKVVY